jgi:hypothetical protein
MILTENGATSYSSENPLIDLYYHSVRDIEYNRLTIMVSKAWSYNPILTMKLIFHLRWCRGGKGERQLFLNALNIISTLDNGIAAILVNIKNIPKFGYWKDLLLLLDKCKSELIKKSIILFYTDQLKEDLCNMKDGKSISLCAKWAPSEHKSMHKYVSEFCKILKVSNKEYRKTYLVPLRSKIDIVETYMCKNYWSDINYENVPSIAHMKYADTFEKHDNSRYLSYLQSVNDGSSKLNTSVLLPYKIIEKYLVLNNVDEFLETQWKAFIKSVKKDFTDKGLTPQGIAVADCSGSMSGIPINNAIALSIMWAELCEGPFSGHMYVFSNDSKLLKLPNGTLKDKINYIMNHATVANTNLQSVIDNMLIHASIFKVSPDMYPSKIFIFTDGQFDQMVNGKTNMEVIIQKHHNAGYKVPHIIFWNLRGNTVDFPSSDTMNNISLVSGYSHNLFKYLLNNDNISPIDMMMLTLNDPAFDCITI